MSKFDIISIGSAMRDIFILNQDLRCRGQICHPFQPENLGRKISVENMYFDIGGGGSNTAVTFANMGFNVKLLSQIGDDLAGKEVLRLMKKFKVNIDLVKVNENKETGYSVIFIDKTGDRTALVFRGASDLEKFKIQKSKLKSDWFFVTSVSGNIRLIKELFDIAKKNKTKIAWNPGSQELNLGAKLKPFLKNIDVLFLNFKEAQTLVGDKGVSRYALTTIFSKLSVLAPKAVICVTGGKKGAWVKMDNSIFHAGILDYKVVNATGAGDAFGSGFVSGLVIYKNDVEKALQLAMLNSNNVVRKMGAKHGLLGKRPGEKMLGRVKVKVVK